MGFSRIAVFSENRFSAEDADSALPEGGATHAERQTADDKYSKRTVLSEAICRADLIHNRTRDASPSIVEVAPRKGAEFVLSCIVGLNLEL